MEVNITPKYTDSVLPNFEGHPSTISTSWVPTPVEKNNCTFKNTWFGA